MFLLPKFLASSSKTSMRCMDLIITKTSQSTTESNKSKETNSGKINQNKLSTSRFSSSIKKLIDFRMPDRKRKFLLSKKITWPRDKYWIIVRYSSKTMNMFLIFLFRQKRKNLYMARFSNNSTGKESHCSKPQSVTGLLSSERSKQIRVNIHYFCMTKSSW